MTAQKSRRAPRRRWSVADAYFLRQAYPTENTAAIAQRLNRSVSQVHQKARSLGVLKSRAVIAAQSRAIFEQPGHGGQRTQIKPGNVPWNKGLRGSTGNHANCRGNWFLPGTLNGHALAHAMPLGSYRVNGEGYLERKVTTQSGAPNLRWQPVHRLVWAAANGPVPAGHIVMFKPGCKTNTLEQITPDKLDCITRQQLMQRNSVHAHYPPEVARLVQLRSALNRSINRKAKEAKTP